MGMEAEGSDFASVQDLCDRLKTLRIQKGISQREIAAEMGMAQGNYQRLESGKYAPKMTTIHIWARALGCKIHFTLLRDEDALDASLDEILKG